MKIGGFGGFGVQRRMVPGSLPDDQTIHSPQIVIECPNFDHSHLSLAPWTKPKADTRGIRPKELYEPDILRPNIPVLKNPPIRKDVPRISAYLLGEVWMFFRLRNKVATQYEVAIDPANISIKIDSGENLLEAVQKRGFFAPYNCRVGACKTCQIVVREGKPKSLIEREYVFSEAEIGKGAYLACQLKVETDMRIEWRGLMDPNATQPPARMATLHSIQQMTPRIFRVALQLETGLQWQPGQFARLMRAGETGTPRCYSLVNRGDNATLMMFDITRYPSGMLSSWLTDTQHVGEQIQVEAPFGQFGDLPATESQMDPPPLLCIAGGSGLGAISGILAHRYPSCDRKNPVVLVYGARDRSEIYGLDELSDLASSAKFPLCSYPILDREPQESAWEGRRGFISHHLEKILDESKRHDAAFQQPLDKWRILLCGPSVMVDTSLEVLRAFGAKPEHISFDKYEQQVS